MSVQITIDQQSAAHLHRQLQLLRAHGNRSLFSALVKVAFKIKTESQMRLTGRYHVVTSRLKNSIYVQAKDQTKVTKPDNRPQYSDKNGVNYDSQLKSIQLQDTELAVGTSAEYGPKIEAKDSYLYWAMRNVNVERSVAQDMRDYMKFGNGVIPTQAPTI